MTVGDKLGRVREGESGVAAQRGVGPGCCYSTMTVACQLPYVAASVQYSRSVTSTSRNTVYVKEMPGVSVVEQPAGMWYVVGSIPAVHIVLAFLQWGSVGFLLVYGLILPNKRLVWPV